jgi:AbrB family looped-hinge helix DNA binding protein
MQTEVTKLSAGGRIVIPARFRKALGVETGDELIVVLEEEELRIFTRRQAIKRAQGMLRRYIPEGRSLVDELIQERRAEAARE